jgi:hypothetical protein
MLERMGYSYGTPPYPPNPQHYAPVTTREDEEQLRILSILYYVYAAMIGMTAIAIGAFGLIPALLIPAASHGASHGEDLIAGGIIFAVVAVLALFLLAKAAVLVLTGRALAARRNPVLCLVGACMSLLNVPLGTALGVFTIVVLQRPGVKARFAQVSG